MPPEVQKQAPRGNKIASDYGVRSEGTNQSCGDLPRLLAWNLCREIPEIAPAFCYNFPHTIKGRYEIAARCNALGSALHPYLQLPSP